MPQFSTPALALSVVLVAYLLIAGPVLGERQYEGPGPGCRSPPGPPKGWSTGGS